MKRDEEAPTPTPMKCVKCGTRDVYKYVKSGDFWLCYEHTAKQHRDFTHNMNDHHFANRKDDLRDSWLYAMQFENHKLPESTYDRQPQSVRLNYSEADVIAAAEEQYSDPVRFDDLETLEDLQHAK